MLDGTRAALLLLALLSSLGLVPLVLRGLRPAPLVALHGAGVAVAFAAAMSRDVVVAGHPALGLPLLAMGALLVVDRGGAPAHVAALRALTAMRVGALVAMVVGVSAATGIRLWPLLTRPAHVVTALTALLLVVFTPLAARQMRGDDDDGLARDRLSLLSFVFAGAILLTTSILGALLAVDVPVVWPVALGACGAIATALRVAPHVAPTPRELVVALFLGVATLFVVSAARGPTEGAIFALVVALFDIGLVAHSRPLLESASVRRGAPPSAVPLVDEGARDVVSREALAALAPLTGQIGALRASKASVAVRVTAQVLLDAALTHARTKSELAKKRRPHFSLVVEDAEADVECDPTELATVLGDVVNAATLDLPRDDDRATRVHLRTGPRHVTYEITGDGPVEAARATLDVEHPFVGGDPARALAIARARLVVERHGGTLVYRQTEGGHFVQVTVPRRLPRSRAARA